MDRTFFRYVVPSVLAFAFSGVYAVVDGYFVGNSVGNLGLSSMNIAYPVTAVIQAVGAGIGMGGAVCFSINSAAGRREKAREFSAGTVWLLILASLAVTVALCLTVRPLLKLLGAKGALLALGEQYLFVIGLGACLQIVGTGLVPLIRNHGGATCAMVTMLMGFFTNIGLDYLFVWVLQWSTQGAALATVIGQGVAMAGGLAYMVHKRALTFKIPLGKAGAVARSVIRIGIAPFGLALTPNLSLIMVNRFSASYGGEEAIAAYACVSYVICIVYLVLQGVGDGCQPLMSRCYGTGDLSGLRRIRGLAYGSAFVLSAVSMAALYVLRGEIGGMLGASGQVARDVAEIFPIFLLAVPFIAVNRITTAGLYATGKSGLSYILTYAEPAAMLVLLLTLPPFFGGQTMIWWGTALARILSAVLAVVFLHGLGRGEAAQQKKPAFQGKAAQNR